MQRRVFFVGSEAEVAHHAAPFTNEDSFTTQVIDPDEVVAAAEPSDIAIFFSEHFDRFRQAVVELKAKRVATIYLVDGILEWRNAWENAEEEPACPFTMRPVLCDKVAVIGSSQARVLAGWGNENKIEVVGIPRLDHLQSRYLETASSDQSDVSPDDVFRILVATAKTPGFTAEQIETTKRSLLNLKDYFDSNPKIVGQQAIEITWRLTAGLENEIGVKNCLSDLSGDELHEAIAKHDAFITTPSTSMLESMLQRKPTALLDYHHCPRYVPAAWTIHSQQSIAPIVEQLSNPTPAKLHFQDNVLADTLCWPGKSRLIQLIHSMFAARDQQLQTGKSFKFEANLLPEPSFVSPFNGTKFKMDYASVYGWSESNTQQDVKELRAQLEHARREVEHQKRIGNGLKAELAEAHAIFEQIHQHPIAGPIVRIRERFIQFMNRDRKDS